MVKVLTVEDVMKQATESKEKGYQAGLKMASVEVKIVGRIHGVISAHVDVIKAYNK